MDKTTVLDKPAQIERYRLRTILAGLSLEAKGMRHSRNSVSAAAGDILRAAGKNVPRSKAKLYTAFKEHYDSLPKDDATPGYSNLGAGGFGHGALGTVGVNAED